MRRASLLALGAVVLAAVGIAIGCGSFSGDDSPAVATDGGPSGGDGSPRSETGAGDARADDAGKTDSAASADPGVFCGPKYCNPQTEVCCVSPSGGGGPQCWPMAEAGACPSLVLGCDDGADCAHVANGVCCGSLGGNNIDLSSSTCYSLSNCQKTPFWVVVCDPESAAATACPGGVACKVPDGGAYGFCDGLVHP